MVASPHLTTVGTLRTGLSPLLLTFLPSPFFPLHFLLLPTSPYNFRLLPIFTAPSLSLFYIYKHKSTCLSFQQLSFNHSSLPSFHNPSFHNPPSPCPSFPPPSLLILHSITYAPSSLNLPPTSLLPSSFHRPSFLPSFHSLHCTVSVKSRPLRDSW